MKTSTLYILAGGAWGLLLGVLGAFAVMGFGASIAWVFLFGDDPWPEAVDWVLPLIGLIAGLAAFGACLYAGWYWGKRVTQSPVPDQRGARRWGYLLLGLPILLGAGLTWAAALQSEKQATERRSASQREAGFARLVESRHTIERIEVSTGDGVATATLFFDGARDGRYRLDWAIREKTYGRALARGSDSVALDPGPGSLEIAVALDRLRQNYRERVLNGAGGVLVDEAFRLTATLEPELSETERAGLSRSELRNLRLGFSPLKHKASANIPVRFTIPAEP